MGELVKQNTLMSLSEWYWKKHKNIRYQQQKISMVTTFAIYLLVVYFIT
jgi:hypothetical protein